MTQIEITEEETIVAINKAINIYKMVFDLIPDIDNSLQYSIN